MKNTTVRDNNNLLYTDPDNAYALPITVLPQGGFYKRTDNRMLSYDFRATANYNHTFNRAHIVNLFGGMESTNIERSRSWFNGVGMQYYASEIPFYIYQFFKKSQEENMDYYTLSNTNSRSAAFFAQRHLLLSGQVQLQRNHPLRGYQHARPQPQRPLVAYMEHLWIVEHARGEFLQASAAHILSLDAEGFLQSYR